MRRAVLFLLALGIAGCGEPTPPSQVAVVSPIKAATPPTHPLPVPDFAHLYNLGLLRASSSVRVGMNWDEALAVFAEPKGSFEGSDLPVSLTQPDGNQAFEARSWQAKDEGFGAILRENRVTVAMDELDEVTQDRVNEILSQYTNEFGQPHIFDKTGASVPSTLTGTHVSYWFWQDGPAPDGQYLMLCATETGPSKFSVTCSIGWMPIMEDLGMAPDVAAGEQRTAEAAIANRLAKRPDPTISSNHVTP